ncbi:MAG: Pantothenate synthetase [Phycisphaerae bacterium]|nr:Pantothenate synthetase [Phycisphaerae bacterium]
MLEAEYCSQAKVTRQYFMMQVLEYIADVRRAVALARGHERTSIGFVPTMGALHTGHASLIRAARQQDDFVVVSIFVNPTQFGPQEDLRNYPRPLERDLAMCREEKVDLVFLPSATEMYGDGSFTQVRVELLSRTLCGAHRPGHFDGVALVVTKLFNIVQPDRAYFGQKDAQQATIIRRMVRDLNQPVDVVVCPTVREADGLAMSSRNAYLSPEQRTQAPVLYRSLQMVSLAIAKGEHRVEQLRLLACVEIQSVKAVNIDYLELVDPETLQPVNQLGRQVLAAGAVRLGAARLIDNLLIDVPD